MKLISGKRALHNVVETVEGHQTKILFDYRGKFNVVTEATIDLIESKGRKLERIKESKNIPAYLKIKKKVKIRAVNLNIVIAQRKIIVEAMILEGSKLCVLLGRHSCREMGEKLQKIPKGDYELTIWDKHLTKQMRRKMLREEKEATDILKKRKKYGRV
ncbi:unnamed protein product [Lasius platythorax]|uniref:Uncharacterized protein n=1 Tax=Lasius platythorax TaxID=488582 RepID=A0AAV2MZJ7_9HYME